MSPDLIGGVLRGHGEVPPLALSTCEQYIEHRRLAYNFYSELIKPENLSVMHENVASMAAARLEPSPQQLDQLLLPDPRANRGDPRLGTQLKRRAGDGTELEDESF